MIPVLRVDRIIKIEERSDQEQDTADGKERVADVEKFRFLTDLCLVFQRVGKASRHKEREKQLEEIDQTVRDAYHIERNRRLLSVVQISETVEQQKQSSRRLH